MYVRYHESVHAPFSRWHRVARTYNCPTVDHQSAVGQLHYSACGLYFYQYDDNTIDVLPLTDGDDHCPLDVCN